MMGDTIEVSAQIIMALRVRAEILDGRADSIEAIPATELPGQPDQNVHMLRLLARELRAVADTAEAASPGTAEAPVELVSDRVDVRRVAVRANPTVPATPASGSRSAGRADSAPADEPPGISMERG